jgi:hypothetical protein
MKIACRYPKTHKAPAFAYPLIIQSAPQTGDGKMNERFT